jgi:hypothetical protein
MDFAKKATALKRNINLMIQPLKVRLAGWTKNKELIGRRKSEAEQ